MLLEYVEIKENIFPHILIHSRDRISDNLIFIDEVNTWTKDIFGIPGNLWFWQRGYQYIPGLNPQFITRYHQVWYSWRFFNKSDAVYFKIRWHNNQDI